MFLILVKCMDIRCHIANPTSLNHHPPPHSRSTSLNNLPARDLVSPVSRTGLRRHNSAVAITTSLKIDVFQTHFPLRSMVATRALVADPVSSTICNGSRRQAVGDLGDRLCRRNEMTTLMIVCP